MRNLIDLIIHSSAKIFNSVKKEKQKNHFKNFIIIRSIQNSNNANINY